jgi:hypothetical protein
LALHEKNAPDNRPGQRQQFGISEHRRDGQDFLEVTDRLPQFAAVVMGASDPELNAS